MHNRSIHLLSLNLGFLLFLLPTETEARQCYYYTDALGRQRRRCTGVLGGGIAGIVIGSLVLTALVFLLFRFINNRRNARSALPVVNQGYHGAAPPPQMGQPHFAPPNFPPQAQYPSYGGGPPPGNEYGGQYQPPPGPPPGNENGNQYQPPPGPPPGEKYEHNPSGIQMPAAAATHH
ncbi:uncharacterized protein MELLADRAFT_79130 [Melampsora larici-populina 98AG31]|uniref:Secreted protein n=1 Tax=Melampsora larici-populina (strain 98AG31 / pathotype 3-4-7) TaxID=747676 RepID=F4S373_MELLP|nr:uncharacterized protein MELLADRAFT_79130 [Melampsora larici-populina 98AG31]EGG00958.1 hypothetical protein MELLADRAFT_79130 [Melampsora larici-populina 98AG31]